MASKKCVFWVFGFSEVQMHELYVVIGSKKVPFLPPDFCHKKTQKTCLDMQLLGYNKTYSGYSMRNEKNRSWLNEVRSCGSDTDFDKIACFGKSS